MPTSIFLAKLIGPVIFIVGLSLFVNETWFRGLTEEFLHSPALLFLAGFIILPAGLAIVLTHNVWVAGWPVIVTILGWLATIGGALRMLAPQRAVKVGGWVYAHPSTARIGAVIWLALGATLSFFGYSA